MHDRVWRFLIARARQGLVRFDYEQVDVSVARRIGSPTDHKFKIDRWLQDLGERIRLVARALRHHGRRSSRSTC